MFFDVRLLAASRFAGIASGVFHCNNYACACERSTCEVDVTIYELQESPNTQLITTRIYISDKDTEWKSSQEMKFLQFKFSYLPTHSSVIAQSYNVQSVDVQSCNFSVPVVCMV